MENIFKGFAGKLTRHSRLAMTFFALLLFVSPGVGYWIFNRQMDAERTQVKESLSRIAHIRADTVSSFVHERRGDAQVLINDPLLRDIIHSWMKRPASRRKFQQQIQQRLHLLKNVFGYEEIALLDRQGNILITSEDTIRPFDPGIAEFEARAISTSSIQVSSIRPGPENSDVGRIIDIVAPFSLGQNQDVRIDAALLLRFDPRRQIYPALAGTPFPSLPNDTLLVEIVGRNVISLSDAHFGSYHYLDVLNIRPDQLLTSARASQGAFTWRLANGELEFGAAHAVAGTSWFIATVVENSSINAMVRHTLRVAVAASGVTLFILGIGILLWWKYKESDFRLAALQTESNRRLLQQKYDYLSKYANDIIVLTDADANILEVNDKALQELGYSSGALTGRPIAILWPPAYHGQLKSTLKKLQQDGTAMFETAHQRSDGTIFSAEVSARRIDFEGQSFNQFICRDITERKEAEHKIQSLAYYDSVTALPNRLLLNDRLDQAIHMAMRSNKKIGVLFMDLDNFKNVNDSLGHHIGDMLLRSVGQRLLSCVREEDTVARIGGDEFLTLLPDLERGEEARHVAEKVIAALARPFELQGQQINTTVSIGISLYPDDAKELSDLVKFADSALYEAKNRGRNNYQFFTKSLNDQITRSSKIERRLRDAMEAGDLSVWYQPQIDVRDGAVIGAEALLRWREGNPDFFTPNDFIMVAEERGLITKLGQWTMREACKQCRLWQMKGLHIVPVAVNVSQIQLHQKEFTEQVQAVLEESGLDASFLELEITESSIMKSAQVVADLAVRLRDSGVRISIDDFGTGYSSLSFLKHIPIDKIKIDRSFVFDMLRDAEDESITQAIISLAQSLRLRVIAEGVESQAQMEKLLALGCHEAQGYLYSRAVGPDTFQQFLENGWHFARAVESEPA